MSLVNRRTFLTATGLGVAALPAVGALSADAAPIPPAPQAAPPRIRVHTGADVLAANGFRQLSGNRVGIITNPTGITADLLSVVDVMHASGNVEIVGVFGPEHGFRGTAQAGEAEDTSIDPRTGLTVYDAYGANTDKMTAMFTAAKVQTVVFDIQDAGARFYTYIWTIYTAMRAAVATGAEFVVLDRPNPTGGLARGPMMTEAYTSGVGAEAIVQAHGMTVGELAGYLNQHILPTDTGGKRLRSLRVIQMKGWRPTMRFADTGLPWVPPSPNMPTPDTALVYPGTGMFEGTNLSEGRGTTRPFELIGAPFLDYRWAQALAEQELPGVGFREAYFTPTFSKHVGKICAGVQVHITDPMTLDPISAAVHMLVQAKRLYPDFAWRYDSYDPVRPYWIDKLTGSTRLRDQITAGADADTVIGAWREELREFDRRRQPHLIYRGPRR